MCIEPTFAFRFIGPSSRRCDWPSTLQCFGVTTEREGWNRPKDLPFVEPSSSRVPGPGSYIEPQSPFCTQLQKRLCNHPIPFGSTGLRPCLKPDGAHVSNLWPSLEPGPGDYNLESQSMVNVLKKKTYGSNGIFGTCTTRFDPHRLPQKVARLKDLKEVEKFGSSPGPVTYDMRCSSKRNLSKPRPVRSSSPNVEHFSRSDDLLIGSRPISKADRQSRQLGVESLRKHLSVNYSLPSTFDRTLRVAHACPFSSLASRTRRFEEGRLFSGELFSETPGPGMYCVLVDAPLVSI